MSKRIPVVGPVAPFAGYGMIVEALIHGFVKRGYDPLYRGTSDGEHFGSTLSEESRKRLSKHIAPDPWELVIHTPEHPHVLGKQTIKFTMWESTRLSPQGFDTLKDCRGIITPSQWGSSCMSAQGIDTAIFVVPLGVNPEVYNESLMDMDGPCIFGAGGRMAHGGARKGVNEVIDAFLKAFPKEKDVRLRVKCFTDCPVKSVTDPRVEFYKDFLPEKEMADWFKGLTAFVSLARSEGWGLMQNASMAVGRPVIACKFAGLAEFMTERNSYCIEYRQRNAEGFYQNMGKWAAWNEDSVIHHMRSVYKDRTTAALKGKDAMRDVKHLTWDNTTVKTLEVLKLHGLIE